MKKYSSWGNYVSVETVDKTYENVIICPSLNDENKHLLEWYNGDTLEIETRDMKSIQEEGREKYIIQ